MRAVGLSDLDMAARAAECVPPAAREEFARAMIERAHLADKVRKRLGRAMVDGSTGSLYDEACRHDRSRGAGTGESYFSAMAVVLEALRIWRARGDQAS